MTDSDAEDRDAVLDAVAAELAMAAYHVVLQLGSPANWVDLELGLWRAMTREVQARWRADPLTELPHQAVLEPLGGAAK